MTIKQLNKYPMDWIVNEINDEGRFVVYSFCFSIIFRTYLFRSKVYFLRKNEWAIKHGWIYMLISCIFGWWGIPYGFLYTFQSIFEAFSGEDCTAQYLENYENYQLYNNSRNKETAYSNPIGYYKS